MVGTNGAVRVLSLSKTTARQPRALRAAQLIPQMLATRKWGTGRCRCLPMLRSAQHTAAQFQLWTMLVRPELEIPHISRNRKGIYFILNSNYPTYHWVYLVDWSFTLRSYSLRFALQVMALLVWRTQGRKEGRDGDYTKRE